MQAPRIARLIGPVLLSFSLSASAQEPDAAETAPVAEVTAVTEEVTEVTAEVTETADSQTAHVSFTSEVIDRQPTDRIYELTNDSRVIYFHTELLGLDGSEVLHRWEFNGQTMAEVPFRVGANRWRVWSTKRLDPVWLGEWKASVVTADGRVLASETFRYSASAPAAPAESPVETAEATDSGNQ